MWLACRPASCEISDFALQLPMALAWARRLAHCGLLVATACSLGTSADNFGVLDKPGTPGMGPVVQFDTVGPVTAVPTQAIPLSLTVTGADTALTLWLEGDYADGSLSQGSLDTKRSHANLVLQTPSEPTTFTVHARTASGSEAHLQIKVASHGFSTITLLPGYAGKRAVGVVTGSVFLQTTCAELGGAALHDGLSVTNVSLGEPLQIAGIPAGPRVSILLRMAHYARGCVDIERLAPAVTTNLETVTLSDLPLDLGAAALDIHFTFEPLESDAASYSTVLGSGGLRAADAFFPVGTPQANAEATTLLGAMSSEVPIAERPMFDANRNQGGWDGALASWLSTRQPSLRSRTLGWLTSAKAEALAPFYGRLTATPEAGKATILPFAWGAVGLGAPAGVRIKQPFAWTATPDDTVHLSGSFEFLPTAFLTHAADRYASLDLPAADVPAALSQVVECGALATSLVGNGTSYSGCGAACTARLCASALATRWRAAELASTVANDVVAVVINASGGASSNDDAKLLDFHGSWVGNVISSTGSSGMKGTVTTTR